MLYKKRNPNRKRLKRRIFLIAIGFAIIIFVFELQAIPFTAKCVKKQSKTISSNIIAEKIEKIQSEIGYTYSDLAKIKYSKNGQVKTISENTVNVNRFKSEATRAIQAELDKKTVYSFKIPLGSFTGITFLSTLGPEIEISFILTGSVNCKLKSTFESGGVNQTVHHIRLIVSTDIITLSPEYSERNTYTTDYDIAQTVIIGQTPSTFADIVR
ncbi:MAG: sporulation protein YunB [Ruminococcus sp.]|nr:sporulation protein YunB [Ruminococcus sp.]